MVVKPTTCPATSPGGVVAPVFAQQVHARDPQRLDVRRLLGRHVAHQVEKFAVQIAGDPPRERLLIFLQRLAQASAADRCCR